MFLPEWREFPSASCLAGKRNLITARGPISLKSRSSLTCFRVCFLPGRANDLLAPRKKYAANFPTRKSGTKFRINLLKLTVVVFRSYSTLPASTKDRIAHTTCLYTRTRVGLAEYINQRLINFLQWFHPASILRCKRKLKHTQRIVLPHWKTWLRHIHRSVAHMTHTPSIHFPENRHQFR